MTMTEVIKQIFLFVEIPIIVTVFACVAGSILPMIFLRTRYSYGEGLGRGLKKYTYPDGRGVLYEPHPSIRKYIHKFLLFTREGYKYLKLSFDEGVGVIYYSVVMLNNRDKVVGVLDVDEKPMGAESASILLHPDTSYVSVILRSVDGKNTDAIVAYRRVTDYLLYFIALSACCFFLAVGLGNVVNSIVYSIAEASLPILNYPAATVSFSVMGGGVGTVLACMHSEKKGVRVVVR